MIPEKDRIKACADESCDFVPCLEKRFDAALDALKSAEDFAEQTARFAAYAKASRALRAGRAAEERYRQQMAEE